MDLGLDVLGSFFTDSGIHERWKRGICWPRSQRSQASVGQISHKRRAAITRRCRRVNWNLNSGVARNGPTRVRPDLRADSTMTTCIYEDKNNFVS